MTLPHRLSAIVTFVTFLVTPPVAGQQFTQIALPADAVNPWYLASAPDSSVWFTILDGNAVGRVTKQGAVTFVPIDDDTFSKPYGIVVSTAGEVWFGSISRNWIKRIDPSGNLSTLYLSGNTRGLCQDPNGFIYATNPPDRIARISTTGHIVEFSLPFQSSPHGCAVDNAGSVWYTAFNTNAIGRLYSDGTAIEYRFPTAETRFPESIVLGADGNMWFTERQALRVGRITPSGVITEYNTTGVPTSITIGSGGALWFGQADNPFTPTLDESALVRLSYSGEPTYFPAGVAVMGIAATPGALWFAAVNPVNALWKFSPPPRRRAVRH